MRLPTNTPGQKVREDSRQLCETLYQAFLNGERIAVPVTEDTTAVDLQNKLSWTMHKFWSSRGFVLQTQQAQACVWVSLRLRRAA